MSPAAANAVQEANWLGLFSPETRPLALVLAGCTLLGTSAGMLGCYAFLRKRSLLGDALAHAALPGVCMAFILTGSKNPYIILAGAVVTCWLGALAIDWIARHTRCKEESALGMVLSVFFGLGVLMLTYVQGSGDAAQAGLDKFLFGQAAAMMPRDVQALALISTVLIACVIAGHKEFKIVSFDPALARSMGMPVGFIELLLATLIVIAVAAGLQAVGVVLMAALLVTPAAAARYWTDRLGVMLALSGVMGGLSGALGILISYMMPNMPTGPWIVVAVTGFFAFSLLFAPRRGIVGRLWRHRQQRQRTARENVLRTMYLLDEGRHEQAGPAEAGSTAARPAYSTGDLLARRPMPAQRMANTLAALVRDGLVEEAREGLFALTHRGAERAARLTRLHRLWEVYLTRKLEIAPDHVHDDAEEIEHILTPELEQRLVAALGAPAEDPHARRIPGGGNGH